MWRQETRVSCLWVRMGLGGSRPGAGGISGLHKFGKVAGLAAQCPLNTVGRMGIAAVQRFACDRCEDIGDEGIASGGNIGEAYIHGLEMVNEAVRQIRGESTCQVQGAELSLAVGGPCYSPGSAVLFSAG